jgi:hypothetical protein
VAAKVKEGFLLYPVTALEDFFHGGLEVVVADALRYAVNICVMRSSTMSITVTMADQVSAASI